MNETFGHIVNNYTSKVFHFRENISDLNIDIAIYNDIEEIRCFSQWQ